MQVIDARSTNRIAVMQGALTEFSLADILQVVSLGRQFTGIELHGENDQPTALIMVKSGKVVEAQALGLRGKEAFVRLFGLNTKSFQVFRSETPASLPEPIGTVRALLVEALARHNEAVGKQASDTTKVGPAPAAPVKAPAPTVRSTHAPVRAATPAGGSPAVPQVAQGRPAAEGRAPLGTAGRTLGAPAPLKLKDKDEAPAKQTRRVVAIASPKGGSGKTTLALNLAVSLARQGRQVILVDASTSADILGAVNSLDRERTGVYDVLAGKASLEQALLPTTIATLRILPSTGLATAEPAGGDLEQTNRWRNLLSSLSTQASIVIVDTPAGMYGLTQQVLAGCTDVIGVLQCETLAQRTFPTFFKALGKMPDAHRPRVLGVFLNMLQPGHPASVSAFREAGAQFPASHLFDTAMPRNPAFLSATETGVPLRLMDESNPPAVTWLFDAMAAEVIDRLGLAVEHRPQRLLV